MHYRHISFGKNFPHAAEARGDQRGTWVAGLCFDAIQPSRNHACAERAIHLAYKGKPPFSRQGGGADNAWLESSRDVLVHRPPFWSNRGVNNDTG